MSSTTPSQTMPTEQAAHGPRSERPVRAEIRATMALAWPVIVSQLGVMAMGLVDVAFVAPLGADALGGTAIGNSAHWMVVTFGFGVLQALDPLLAQAWGAGERDRLGTTVWQGIWLALSFGVAGMVLTLQPRWLFDVLAQPRAVGDLAASYLGALAPGIVPFLLFVVGRSLLAAMGITSPVMVITLLANLVNAGLDATLIHGWLGAPAMGVYGAGLATTLTRWAMVAALAWVVWRKRATIDLRPVAPIAARLRRLWSLGSPIATQNMAEFGVFGAASMFAGWLGASALAAHQIALNLAAFVFMVPVGISIAAAVRVGNAIGAGNPDGAALAGRVALGLGAGFMAIGGVVFLGAPALLASTFAGGDPVLVDLAAQLMRIAAAFQIADGIQVVASGALRGAGETRRPMVANLLAHWCFGLPLGWVLAFPLGMGVHGLWWGLTGSLVVAATLLATLFLRGEWRRIGRVHA